MHTRLKAAALLGTLLTTAGLVLAGPLNPPAGAVASSGKTLTEVEPRVALSQATTPGDVAGQFKITQPGSYYLTGDMTAIVAGNPIIYITASDVTLDLSGYSVRGSGAEGIRIGGDRVTVRNGRVTLTSAADGVYVLTGADELRLEGLSVWGASSAGIRTQGSVSGITVTDTTVVGGQYGVYCADSATAATLTNVQCRGCTTTGVLVGNRSVLDHCTVRDIGNAGGINGYGIYTGLSCTLRDCQVLDTTVAGGAGPSRALAAGSDSVIDGCTVYSQGQVGVTLNGAYLTLRNTRVRMLNTSATAVSIVLGNEFIADNQLSANAGVAVQAGTSVGSTIIRNHITDATTAIAGTALASNIVGPVASNGNPTASTNPHANFVN